MKIENPTTFPLQWVVLFDKKGAERFVVTLKATYTVASDGKLTIAAEQDPLRAADEFYGEPGVSSLRYESELGPPKLATDVALIGSAVAREPETRVMDVQFRVGPLQKRLRVFGNRRWGGFVGIYSPSKPEPFDRMPLTYENAFGGKDISAKDPKHHDQEYRNPVGRGFVSKSSQLKTSEMLLPNIEDPDKPFARPGLRVQPQGFGFIGRDWQPRVAYVGTYDKQWTDARMPLLPLDFDERYHNAAHPDLTAQGYLRGDEAVDVLGCTPGGRLTFALPGTQPHISVLGEKGREAIVMNLNTVLVDADAMKLHLVWKGDLNVHRRLLQLTQMDCRMRSTTG